MKVVPSEVTVMVYFLNLRNDWNRKILEGTGNGAASWWDREKRIIISVFVIIFEGSYVESSKKSSACMFNVHQYRETSWKWECQLCLTLRDSMDHSPPGSSVCGILQARIPEWVAISSSMGYSRARDWTHISFITGRLLTVWAAGEAPWWTLNTLFTLAYKFFSLVPLPSHVRLCDPMDARLPYPSPAPRAGSDSCPSSQWCHPTISSSSPPAFSLSQHQGLFQWVSSSHQVAKILEFQLQHQSFQWIFRTDFL